MTTREYMEVFMATQLQKGRAALFFATLNKDDETTSPPLASAVQYQGAEKASEILRPLRFGTEEEIHQATRVLLLALTKPVSGAFGHHHFTFVRKEAIPPPATESKPLARPPEVNILTVKRKKTAE